MICTSAEPTLVEKTGERKTFMMKLAEKCVAHDMEIVSCDAGVSPTRYNIEITDSVVERVMSAEAMRPRNSPIMNAVSSTFTPPFFDDGYLDVLSDLAPVSE